MLQFINIIIIRYAFPWANVYFRWKSRIKSTYVSFPTIKIYNKNSCDTFENYFFFKFCFLFMKSDFGVRIFINGFYIMAFTSKKDKNQKFCFSKKPPKSVLHEKLKLDKRCPKSNWRSHIKDCNSLSNEMSLVSYQLQLSFCRLYIIFRHVLILHYKYQKIKNP